MRMSQLFGRRQRERAAHTDSTSHDLLLRAGWMRQHAAGIYTLLTPGLLALRRIEAILREEMERAGAHEILMPVVHAADVWKATGRHEAIDATLVRFRDRRGHDMVLAMTHEEIVAQLAASEMASHRDAGIVVYQIQTKFRDEARPRGGLLRTREFIMKDAYSLHLDSAGMEGAYEAQAAAYARIFRRVGLLDVRRVRSGSGDMGGAVAHEFMAPAAVGDDTIAACDGCGDVANAELVQRDAACAVCGGTLRLERAVEVGNIFQLGTRYSEALGARAADEQGVLRPLVMGSYGIGVTRLLAVLIETYHDDAGIALPAAVAPFDVHVVDLGAADTATDVAAGLERAGLRTLVDDRRARPGEKFADADLIGATVRLVVGGRSGASGRTELRERRTGRVHEVAREDAASAAASLVAAIAAAEAPGFSDGGGTARPAA